MKITHLPRLTLELVIRAYQKTISPDHSALGHALFPNGYCQFNPSCSMYTRIAIQRFGALRGTWMGVKRVTRCAPWNPGGDDPVPLVGTHAKGASPARSSVVRR